MEASSLVVGRTYYRITFADPGQTMPGAQPMVFVGCGILEDDSSDSTTYYFQDTVSVVQFGLVGQSDRGVASFPSERKVFSFSLDELGTSIVDLKEASMVFENAYARAEALGHPNLAKVDGG